MKCKKMNCTNQATGDSLYCGEHLLTDGRSVWRRNSTKEDKHEASREKKGRVADGIRNKTLGDDYPRRKK